MNKTENTRHKSVPIPESITKVGRGYPDKLVIFQLSASKFWWVRYYTQKKILKKSTKTTIKQDAIKSAILFYEDILLRERHLLPLINSPYFERCANEMLLEQQRLIDRGERNPKLNVDDKQKLNSDILPYFRGYDIKEITYKHIDDFIAQIALRGLKSSTLKKYTVLIRKIFAFAQRENLVDRVPSMPKIRMKDSARGWFSHDEYVLLRKTTAEAIKNNVVVRSHVITDEMRFLITFVVNSFLRPSDVKNLRHRNIQIAENAQTYLRILPETSKTVNTPIVTMEDAVHIYREIVALNLKNKNKVESDKNKSDVISDEKIEVDPNDFVFFPHLTNRNFALDTMRRQFEAILKLANLKTAYGGEPRTMYSLRHTSIMFRLTKGDHIDLLTLARNARTSVDMIERFYARPLSGEMNIDKIQSMRT